MSNPILPRKPAFATLQPSPPEFMPLDRSEPSLLLSCVGSGRLLGRRGADTGIDGYYLHQSENGDTTFLKVVPTDHAKRQAAADAVASWVAHFGVRTPIPLPGFPRMMGNDHTVFAYQYIVSRFANTTVSDLSQIGTSLAIMHAALAQYPDSTEVQRTSAIRTAMLTNRRNIVCSGLHSAGPKPARLREIFEREMALFSLLEDAPEHQPLHGDLVYGNILFPMKDGAPVLLDFEDTLISWLPIDIDIALALERFILLPEQDDDMALVLGRGMLRAYGEARGKDSGFLAHPLSDSLRLLSVRALATLAEMEAQGSTVNIAEWEKFFNLYQHAIARSHLLATLQEEFLA